jgi:hypothetical protein
MSTSVSIYVNNTSEDEAYGSSGVNWVVLNPGIDSLIFTNGSPSVANGQSIPSSFQLSSAGIVLNGTTQVVPVYLLASIGSNLLYQIYLMGSGNYQHVLAFDFNGVTTSEPVLEIWDNVGLSTTDDISLGSGTPSNSWFKGIATTFGLPGVSWIGSPLAGSSDGNFLYLNNGNGALTGATTLYAQLQVIVPSSQTQGSSEQPVITVKYTTT